MLPSFVSSSRARQWSTGLRHIVAGIVACTCWAAWYSIQFFLFFASLFVCLWAIPSLWEYLIRVAPSSSPVPDPVAWGIFILFALFVLAVLWARGDFDFVLGSEYTNRREQDDFRYEHNDRWDEYWACREREESEFGTEYGDGWEEDNAPERQILDEEHRKQLKQLFRRAAQSCHPDKAPEHVRDAAHELFTQLNAAFQANDIEAVRNISDIVRSGAFANPSR